MPSCNRAASQAKGGKKNPGPTAAAKSPSHSTSNPERAHKTTANQMPHHRIFILSKDMPK
jgi:hypothetical protein